MLLVAHLSKQLGSALKIKPYYRILYGTAAIILAAGSIDIILSATGFTPGWQSAAFFLRCAGSALALLACFPYWKWLFAEYFSPTR
jgi:hypothetical protein